MPEMDAAVLETITHTFSIAGAVWLLLLYSKFISASRTFVYLAVAISMYLFSGIVNLLGYSSPPKAGTLLYYAGAVTGFLFIMILAYGLRDVHRALLRGDANAA